MTPFNKAILCLCFFLFGALANEAQHRIRDKLHEQELREKLDQIVKTAEEIGYERCTREML